MEKKSSQQRLRERYEAGDPTVGLLGEPSGKFDYYVQYGTAKRKLPTIPSPCSIPPPLPPSNPEIPCFMFEPDDFPPLSFDHPVDHTRHVHKIPEPQKISSDGSRPSISAAEATLNWQSENALAQNRHLQKISQAQVATDNKISSLENLIHQLQEHIQRLHQELLTMTSTAYINSATFLQKEAEMKHLKNQLQTLEAQQRASLAQFASPFDPVPSMTSYMLSSYRQTTPQPLFTSSTPHTSLIPPQADLRVLLPRQPKKRPVSPSTSQVPSAPPLQLPVTTKPSPSITPTSSSVTTTPPETYLSVTSKDTGKQPQLLVEPTNPITPLLQELAQDFASLTIPAIAQVSIDDTTESSSDEDSDSSSLWLGPRDDR